MNDYEKYEGELKEYELLRQELMGHDRAVLQVIGIVLGFIGVMTAQGITSYNPYVFLVPLPILTLMSIYISDKRWIIWLMASYITKFVEDRGLGPQWETKLFWFRTACKESRGFIPGQNVILVDAILFVLLGVLEATLFIIFAFKKGIPYWHYVFVAILLTILIIQSCFTYCRLMREGRKGAKRRLEFLWKKATELQEKEIGHHGVEGGRS